MFVKLLGTSAMLLYSTFESTSVTFSRDTSNTYTQSETALFVGFGLAIIPTAYSSWEVVKIISLSFSFSVKGADRTRLLCNELESRIAGFHE